MKIGFLNPWRMAAENQAFSSLRIAAERLGHELVHCSNSEEVDSHAPAFVLASASTQPKLSDFPHYGVIHEPRDRFLAHRRYFDNILTYDGYLTISETLDRFLRDLSLGAGRPMPTGFYYNTCQRQDFGSDLQALIHRRALRITYFGTNWDKRRENFFRLLSEAEGVQICGPAHSWPQISRNSYGGQAPFDGSGVQRRYAENGIGLCMLSDLHLRDDIISNRIFEIASVGAIAICCDLPWIRRHFGDSVYYFDQNLPDKELCRAVLKLRQAIYANPVAALSKARRARETFEENFSAEHMIENAVNYHRTVCSSKAGALQKAEAAYSPVISVIVRCGSRPVQYIRRAIQSIENQTYGQFEVLLVRHRNLDVSSILARSHPRIRSIKVIESQAGNRSASLWAGLQAVGGEYFAVLDDDDWWFSDHFEKLFLPWPSAVRERFFAYSGTIIQRPAPQTIEGGAGETRDIYTFGITSHESWSAVTSAFASNCFVASSDLLHEHLLVEPEMDTAEDSYLILSLAAQVETNFSYAATAAFDRSLPDQSAFSEHPKRYEDELTLQLRTFGKRRPSFLKGDTWTSLATFWSKRPGQLGQTSVSGVELKDWDEVARGFDPRKSKLSRGSRLIDAGFGRAVINPPLEPWAYGAELFLNRPEQSHVQYALVAELMVTKGGIGIGILNQREDDFIFRKCLPQQSAAHLVEIPVTNLPQIGRFVVQNWEAHGECCAELLSLRLLAEPLF